MQTLCLLVAASVITAADGDLPEQRPIPLTAWMIVNESELGNPQAMADEQSLVGDPPSGEPENAWEIPSQHWGEFPYAAHIRLDENRHLAALWIYDTFGIGKLRIEAGVPGAWEEIATIETNSFRQWRRIPLDVDGQFVRLVRLDPGSNFAEIALYEYTPAGIAELQARRQAESERQEALRRAAEEARHRPLVDLGPPYGRLPLIDEVDLAATEPRHRFQQDPGDATHIETILGEPCRILKKYDDEAAYFAVRMGEMKLLQPGHTYVLTIDFPEDTPRTWLVLNGGCETSTGFHTGTTVGDAFHPKYVDNLPESLQLPLSQGYRRWTMVFRLHDRFPELGFPRGAGPRPLLPEDGFAVVIAQFSAPNMPCSAGAAVRRIRLFEVPNPEQLACPVQLPPAELPRRHIFWREEMADGVIAAKEPQQRGVTDPLDWYRYKASRMKHLGIRTYSKDLLEFGACQHWDSSPAGGNDWVYFNADHKDLWRQIVALMGEEGFDILPYYEYSGSKGAHGLGPQRRAKPLKRDDAYTHIRWIENANADITDPDTYEDFRKMLQLTVVQHREQARFAGIWLRPRAQLPIGFGDATRARFAKEANDGRSVSRKHLQDDPELLHRYYAWWYGKRCDFLVAMRNYLIDESVGDDPTVLFTACMAESGVSFPTWEKRIVSDDVEHWRMLIEDPLVNQGKEIAAVSVDRVVNERLYHEALLAAPLTWGGWEVHHANPPPDPQHYRETPGVLFTHAINRYYTVASPETFDAFRGPAGLAVVRHYPLNEDMIFDATDQSKLDYYVADIEYAGPYCMMAEAMAVANGDPRFLGNLTGSNFNRGFPEYVRAFNAAFLALPALPSRVLEGASEQPAVTVRSIPTAQHGTYYAVVNTGKTACRTTLSLDASGAVLDATSGQPVARNAQSVAVELYPFQLRALHIPATD